MEMKLQSYDDYKLSRDFTFVTEDEDKVLFSVGKEDNSIIISTKGDVPLGELEEAIATLKGWLDSGEVVVKL